MIDFQNLRQRIPLNFDDTEEDPSDNGFDNDFDDLSLYQPKDLPKYGQRVTLGSQDVPAHLKRTKSKNKNCE